MVHLWNTETLASLLPWKVGSTVSTAELSLQGTGAPPPTYASAPWLWLCHSESSCHLVPCSPQGLSLQRFQMTVGSFYLAAGKGVSASKTAHSLATPSRSSFASADPSKFWFPDLIILTNPPSDVRERFSWLLTQWQLESSVSSSRLTTLHTSLSTNK